MRITIYNEKGYPIETKESALVPKPDNEGVFYVEYDSFEIKVISKVERILPQKEKEKIVAVKSNGRVIVFEELPPKLVEHLGLKESGVVRKEKVSV